jgi:hypothetical protein
MSALNVTVPFTLVALLKIPKSVVGAAECPGAKAVQFESVLKTPPEVDPDQMVVAANVLRSTVAKLMTKLNARVHAASRWAEKQASLLAEVVKLIAFISHPAQKD